MLNGNLFNKALIYFLIFFILVLIGALLDLNAQEICLVTVDMKTNKNMILWSTSDASSTCDYNILKETSRSGVYAKIGSVPFNRGGKFIDTASDPGNYSYRYKIVTYETEENADTSDFHQTIHLVISKGLPETYNLIWTQYVGFEYDTYYIYKGYEPDKLFLFDSLANTYNQYTDSTDRITYYQIAVRKKTPCYISDLKSNREPISQSVSNLEDNIKFINPVGESFTNAKIKIYPVPFSKQLTIELFLEEPEVLKLEIYNQLGETVHSFTSGSIITGNFRYDVPENICSLNSGFYILKVFLGKKAYYAKILKIRN